MVFQLFFNSREQDILLLESIVLTKNDKEEKTNVFTWTVSDYDKMEVKTRTWWESSLENKDVFISYISQVSEKIVNINIPKNWQDKELYLWDREKLEEILAKTDSAIEKHKEYESLDEYFIYYNRIRNLIERYKELEEAFDTSVEAGFTKKTYSIPKSTHIQKFRENTCVVDTLYTIMNLQYGKELDKTLLYERLWKKIWDYWQSEYYHYNGVEKWGHSNGDYRKLAQLGIFSEYSQDIVDVEKRLKNGEIALFEAPITQFSNDGKWKGTNIYHAVTLFEIENGLITYADTLDWMVKTIPLSNITQTIWDQHYAFRFFSFDNTKIESLKKLLK